MATDGISLAMVAGVGLGTVARVIHAYPTQAEAIKTAANNYARTLVSHVTFDQQRAAWIGDAQRRRLHQAKLAVSGRKQHDAAIGCHAAAVKSTFHDSAAKPAKFNLAGSNFLGTVWHWQSQLLFGLRQ